MKMRTTAAAIVIATTATMGLTACGGKEAPKAKDAFNKAQDQMGKYKSIELKASGKTDGKPLDLTLKGDVDGDPQSVDAKMEGTSMEAIVNKGKAYVKADAAYWKQAMGSSGSASLQSKMADKWLESPNGASKNDNVLTSLLKEIKDDSSASNKKLLSDKATVTEDSVDGKDAWKIESEDKKTRAWVSQDDSRDLLKLDGWDGSSSKSSNETMTTINFLSHDKDYGIKAPSDAKSMTDIMKG